MRRPLVILCLAYASGIVLGLWLSNLPPKGVMAGSFAGSALAVFVSAGFLVRARPFVSNILLPVAAVFAGAFALARALGVEDTDNVANLVAGRAERLVTVEGSLVTEPVASRSGEGQGKYRRSGGVSFVLKAVSVSLPEGGMGEVRRTASGLVRVLAGELPVGIDSGDRVSVRGRLSRPSPQRNPGVWSQPESLRLRGIHAVLKASSIEFHGASGSFPMRSVLWLRKKLRDRLQRTVPSSQEPLFEAMLLGNQAALAMDVRQLFARTGTAHILAVSGLNVGIIYTVTRRLLQMLGFSSRIACGAGFPIILLYVFLTGANTPVVRAGIMVAAFILAELTGRQDDSLNTLAGSALVILLLNPLQLFSASFQLSFAAVAGVLLFYGPVLQCLPRWLARSKCARAIVVSGAAQVAVAPLVAVHFNLVAVAALLCNLIAIPVLEMVLVVGSGSCLASFLSMKLASLVNGALAQVLQWLEAILGRIAALPGAWVTVPAPPVWFIALYYVIVWFGFHLLERSPASTARKEAVP